MTDLFTNQLTATLAAVWGIDGFSTWVEPSPPSLGSLSPQETDLLLAGIALLNWDMLRFNLFLKEKFAIAKIQDLRKSQIDIFFESLNTAVANWKENRIEGYYQEASLSSLSCRYWQARLALYPQSVQASKKRKKWILDGYKPPEYNPKITEPEIEPEPEPEIEPPDWVDPMDPWHWYLVA